MPPAAGQPGPRARLRPAASSPCVASRERDTHGGIGLGTDPASAASSAGTRDARGRHGVHVDASSYAVDARQRAGYHTRHSTLSYASITNNSSITSSESRAFGDHAAAETCCAPGHCFLFAK